MKSFYFLASFSLSVLLLTGCRSDTNNEPDNEQELITTVELTFQAQGMAPVTAIWNDTDGPGGNAPTIDTIRLEAGVSYELTIGFFDRSNPLDEENITEEIRTEADEHLVCYSVPDNLLTVPVITDTDDNGQPLGLRSNLGTLSEGQGSFGVRLIHEADKDAASPCTTGETDAEVSFPVVVTD